MVFSRRWIGVPDASGITFSNFYYKLGNRALITTVSNGSEAKIRSGTRFGCRSCRTTYQFRKDTLVQGSLGLAASKVLLVVLLQARVVCLPFLFAVLTELGNAKFQ